MLGPIVQLPPIPDVSLQYQYEDDEVKNILSIRLSELKKAGVYTPELTVGNAATSLKDYLSQERIHPEHFGKRTLLIPYNKSGAHWVALVIKINALNELEKIIYIDSLQENQEYFYDLCQEIKIVYGSFSFDQVDIQKRLKQGDSSSCGPLTIENLIEVANDDKPLEIKVSPYNNEEIRRKHVQIYHRHDPSFYDRQRNNTNRVVSAFQSNLWLKKAGSNFREKEILRISKLVNLIKNMPALKEDLIKILAKQSGDEKHKDHLDRLRENLLSIFNKDTQNKFLVELLRTLFNLTDVDLSKITDLGNYRFQLDYEELAEICREIDNEAINCDLEKRLEDSIKKQIENDRELAEKIQMGLLKESKSEDKDEKQKNLSDPFLWQIQAYYRAVIDKIENLTAKEFEAILVQLVTQIKKIDGDKLSFETRMAKEEIERMLIKHLEGVLGYLLENPKIGTSESIDDFYEYTESAYFEEFLHEQIGKPLDLDKLREHIDIQLRKYSWKGPPLWQLHMQGHTNVIINSIRESTPVKITQRLSAEHLDILLKYPQFREVIIEIAQLETKAFGKKENEAIKKNIQRLKYRLCNLMDDLICRQRRQNCVNVLRLRQRQYIEKFAKGELGFYDKNKAFQNINDLGNLIFICSGKSGLGWLVNQIVEYQHEVPEFILENINRNEIGIESELIDELIQSQCLYRIYDTNKLDDNFISRTFLEGIEKLRQEIDLDEPMFYPGYVDPFNGMRENLLSKIKEKYKNTEEWLHLNLKEMDQLHLEYNEAYERHDFISIQRIWGRFTRFQRKLHLRSEKGQTKEWLTKLHQESKSRVDDYYTRVYPAHNTRYLVYSSKNKNRSKIAELDLFPFFAKLALIGRQIKGEIIQCGTEKRTKTINVVTVFLCFVVSTKPHKKGGDHERKFISINLDLEYKNSLLSKDPEDKVFSSDNRGYFYTKVKKDYHDGSCLLYGNPLNPTEYTHEIDKVIQTGQAGQLLHHSERVFFEVMCKKDNLKKIINLLKIEIKRVLNIKELQPGLYKLYSMAILLYSTNSVCNYCTPGIVAMQNSHDEGFVKSFLKELSESEEAKKHFKIRGCYPKEGEKEPVLDPTKFKTLTLVTSDKAFTEQARDTEDKASSKEHANPKAKLFFYSRRIDLHNANTRCFVEYVGLDINKLTLQMPRYPGVAFMSGSKDKPINREKLDKSVNQLIGEERKDLGIGK